jgi:hypothetical protein
VQKSYLYVTVHEDNNKLFHIELINLGRIVGASFWPHPFGTFSYMFHSKSYYSSDIFSGSTTILLYLYRMSRLMWDGYHTIEIQRVITHVPHSRVLKELYGVLLRGPRIQIIQVLYILSFRIPSFLLLSEVQDSVEAYYCTLMDAEAIPPHVKLGHPFIGISNVREP